MFQTVGEKGLDNARGIRHSYRIIIITWCSEGGIPRVLYPTPQLLYTPATLSPASASYGSGDLRVVRRIQALLALADNQSVQEVAEMLNLGQQTIRDYRNAFLLKGVSSLVYTRPPGRPST